MSTFLVLLSCLVAIIFAGHATFAILYVRKLRAPRPLLTDKQCPRAAIILCLRGRDPSLERCLEGLLSQDYPHYEVMIVVDQRADPAWDVAASVIEQNSQLHVSLQPLVERRRTCSLKCSAIVQAVSELEESAEVEVYALIDQDVIPHATWLRELVTPLAESNVAASCGYRWFMPNRRSLASLIRAQWNAGSVALMVMNRICWGGSLALRADFIRKARLLDKWSRAICEDTMIGPAAREQNARVALLPSLHMVNQESCSLASLFPFIRRQTWFGFLYNPSFKVRNRVVTVVYNATLAGGLVLTCVAAARGNRWAIPLGLLLAGYVALLIGAHWRIDAMTAEKRRSRGESTRGPDVTWAILLLICFPLSQLISLAAVVSTLRMPTIIWRGVRYRIRGPLRIERLEADTVLEQPALADEQLDLTHHS
jgi:glycosyltransferase involved in cell wall biosynthesis